VGRAEAVVREGAWKGQHLSSSPIDRRELTHLSLCRKFLKGVDSPGSRPASRDANALRKKSVEEPKKATKPKQISRDEKERQKRLQDQEKRRMKEADLLRAQG
jgi:hypothetical protein